MPWVWVSLGSNVDRERSLRGAVRALRTRVGKLVLSSVYESASVGSDGPPFYNLVAGFDTELGLRELDAWLRQIEDAFGRVRQPDKNAPRTLDIDILTYADLIDPDGYHLPRDEILRYAFVLGPLAEVAPCERHPLDGRRYAELWADFPKEAQPLAPVALPLD